MTVMGEELGSAVAAAAQGDRAALARVLASIRPLVVRYCRARVGSAERGQLSADDVAQEVCLAVMTALPRYQDQGRPFMRSCTALPHTRSPMRTVTPHVTVRIR